MRYLFLLIVFVIGCTTIHNAHYYPPECCAANGYVLNSALDQKGNVYYRMIPYGNSN